MTEKNVNECLMPRHCHFSFAQHLIIPWCNVSNTGCEAQGRYDSTTIIDCRQQFHCSPHFENLARKQFTISHINQFPRSALANHSIQAKTRSHASLFPLKSTAFAPSAQTISRKLERNRQTEAIDRYSTDSHQAPHFNVSAHKTEP